jgi:predicted metal-dependent hydrolase
MTEHAVAFGQKTIRFSLEQKPRKALRISVMPDMSVGVSAPHTFSIEKVLRKVQRRASWIVRQINYFKSYMPKEPPRQFISGETHYYYGRQYRLKVMLAKKQDVKLKGKYIFVYSLRTDSRPRTKRLVYEWYRARAQQMFAVITERCHERLEKYGIKLPAIDVKSMKSRWGSCVHTKGRIGLNTELIKAPSHCIEYVIMHEMCHLKYPNHTRQFYNFLSLVMPDWEKRKARLERVVI